MSHGIRGNVLKIACALLTVVSFAADACGGMPDLSPKPLVVGIADNCKRPGGSRTVYIDALVRAGHIPVLIGRCHDSGRMAEALKRIDVLLFSGGEDVNPRLYGEEMAGSRAPNGDRDDFEALLFKEAVKLRKPMFGICRGLQIMNVLFGGSLYQDIPTAYASPDGAPLCKHNPKTDVQTGPPAHDIVIERDSRLFAATGAERLAVNSSHHQGVKKLAPGFRVSARATDGFVEAIESDSYPAAGVQFHPEALVAGRPNDPRYDLAALEAILRNIGKVCGKGCQE